MTTLHLLPPFRDQYRNARRFVARPECYVPDRDLLQPAWWILRAAREHPEWLRGKADEGPEAA
jgi:hypothetical protein